MLTVTYTFVAISNEQKNVRNRLTALCTYIRNFLKRAQALDHPAIHKMLVRIRQFDQYCHERKLERYLIPAVHGIAEEVDAVLAAIEGLAVRAAEKLNNVQQVLQHAPDADVSTFADLGEALEAYCDCMLQRLAKEEDELLPLLRHLLSIDEWFPIAAQFLSDDQNARRRHNASHFHSPQNTVRGA